VNLGEPGFFKMEVFLGTFGEAAGELEDTNERLGCGRPVSTSFDS
jgi:hypothetical protein